MKRAVIKGAKVTLAWAPSRTDEVSGNTAYTFFADNGQEPGGFFGGATNATATTGLSFSNPSDPTIPTISITKDTRRQTADVERRRGPGDRCSECVCC